MINLGKYSTRKTLIIILLIAICLCVTLFNINYKSTSANQNESSEIVMEATTNRVLYQKNAHAKKYMASTTKILTAITIIENCDVEENVIVTNKTVGVEGSSIYLEEGEILSVKDLLYGLMLRSGNDCAETLALHCSGSIKNFAILMNKLAKKIGATNSNFVNPHGLHDDNHYTTAYDLGLISCYAMKNSLFREIVGTKVATIPFTTRNTKRTLVNKNKMLKEYNGSTGIKTGYTKKAGRCLVSSCKKNGMELISVVLNCPQMFEQSKYLLNNAFNNFKMYKILQSDNIVDFLTINNRREKCIAYIKNDIYLPLTKDEKEEIIINYEYNDKLFAPIKKDQILGYIKFTHKNNLLFEEKIYNIIEIK